MENDFYHAMKEDPILDGPFMGLIQVRPGMSWIQRTHTAYAQEVQACLRTIAIDYWKEAEPAVSCTRFCSRSLDKTKVLNF